jgi:hypothetical protein
MDIKQLTSKLLIVGSIGVGCTSSYYLHAILKRQYWDNAAHILTLSFIRIVISNLFVISSCELLKYEGGSLGLFKYSVDDIDGCIDFTDDVEDEAVKTARLCAVAALGLGSFMLLTSVIHNFFVQVPFNDILVSLLGAATQLFLTLIYTLQKNDLCETFGCSWGNAMSWTGLAHVMYLSGLVGALCPRLPFQKRAEDISRRSRKSQLDMA